MSRTDASSKRSFTLDDLIALNEEMASLVRAGVPLEIGLAGLGQSVSGRLRRLSDRLAQRLAAGNSLSEALAEEGEQLPRGYRAVVEAGLHTGRLPEALESLTRFARSVAEIRRQLALALIYPCIVLAVAYGLFIAFILGLAPEFAAMYESYRLPVRGWLTTLRFLHETVTYWGPTVPIVVLLLGLIVGLWGRPLLAFGDSVGGVGWVPGIKNYHRAVFTHLLSILVEHEVPLPEALRLAAEATGNRRLVRQATNLAEDVQQGRSLRDSLPSATWFPPFMKWMMSAGEQQGALAAALKQLSEVYRRRVARRARVVQLVVPVLLTLGIGGGVVLVYALSLFVPLSDLLKDMSI